MYIKLCWKHHRDKGQEEIEEMWNRGFFELPFINL